MDNAMAGRSGGELVTRGAAWPAVAAAAAGLIFSQGTLMVYSFGVFVGPLSREFGWSRTELSFAILVSQVALALSSPAWGVLVDRFGPRRVLLPSIVMLSGLVASLSLLTPHTWHFYAVFAAVSLLAGGASPLGYSAILVRRFDRNLGLALGLALMGVGLGATIIPPLAQTLLGPFGWRGAYVGLGAVTLLVTIPAALLATRDLPPLVRGRAAENGSIGAMVRTRAFVLVCLAFLILGGVSIGALAHLVPMMVDHGLTAAAAAGLAGATGIAAIVARGGVGWLLDRVHAPFVLAGVALMASVAFLLLAFGDGGNTGFAAAVLLGLLVGAETDFISFLIRRYFGPVPFGRLYGIAFGVFVLGTGTGPLLLGASFDRLGSYRPGLLLFAVLGVATAAIALAMPRYAGPRDAR